MALFLVVFCLLFCCWHIDAVCIDKPDTFDPTWVKIGRTSPDKSIELLFALKQQNIDVLVDTLLNVSTPKHPKYGEHLTTLQIHEMVKPSDLTINTIIQWLLSFNIPKENIKNRTINGDFLTALTTIQTAENILNCNYYDYKNSKIPIQSIVSRLDTNCDYNLPSDIAIHLDFISPTKRFPSIKQLQAPSHTTTYNHAQHDIDDDNQDVTPEWIQELYHVQHEHGKSPLNKMGIASFDQEYFTDSDIITFWNKYNVTNNSINSITRLSNSGIQPSGYGDNATMFVEYATGLGQSIASEVWYTADINGTDDVVTTEPFLLFILDILNSTNPPPLFIVGYSDYEMNLGYDYCSRCSTEFAKIGAMGITMLVTSGSYGVGDDEQCCSETPIYFCPMFPSTSPFVTAVGATRLGNPDKSPPEEHAWWESGGGFSTFFDRPQWQYPCVQDYLDYADMMHRLPPEDLWNNTGRYMRGYPDVSGQSFKCETIVHGKMLISNSTGCGTSIVGGIFSLLR